MFVNRFSTRRTRSAGSDNDNSEVVTKATCLGRGHSRHLPLISCGARSDLSYFWGLAFVNIGIEGLVVLVTNGARESQTLSCECANARARL
jgi:hypothetical protein